MLLIWQGCRVSQSLQIFKVYFSDMERALLWQDECHKHQEGISRLHEDSTKCIAQQSRTLSLSSERPSETLGLSSVSNINKDAFYHRVSTIQKCSRRFFFVYKSKESVPCQPSGRSYHPVRTLICPLFHPSERRAISSGRPNRSSIIRPEHVDFCPDPLLYQEVSVPACIRPDVSAARPDASQYSTKLQILSKFIYGKIDATVQTTWIPVRTPVCHLQDTWYGNCIFSFNRLDTCLSWSGRAQHRYGNCVLKINRLDSHPPWSECAKALYGNYLQQTCDRLNDSVSNRKYFQRKSQKFWSHSCPSRRRPYILLQSPIWTLNL